MTMPVYRRRVVHSDVDAIQCLQKQHTDEHRDALFNFVRTSHLLGFTLMHEMECAAFQRNF